MNPGCPECGRELAVLEVLLRRNLWGGGGPRPRPEQWWECTRCDWLGYRRRVDEELRPMRRLTGEEADCFFCGDEGNASGRAWEQDGELRAWMVCLACGTSNQIRVEKRS
ncbi:hypothetical protein GCM10010439_74100 [Actinocorallia aurantiaca]|uniref:Uncharacterized protein n=1 Tax=Actinocorallia aurantiaca TaxID=46204 RepID=A0ABN3UVW0_9ACTN